MKTEMSEARRADFHHIHDAWIEATNVYLAVILISIGLFLYVKKHFKRPMIRVFPSSVQDPASAGDRRKRADDLKNVRLRQQLEHCQKMGARSGEATIHGKTIQCDVINSCEH
ncbi:small integral membrane protein 19-like isoform X2 [Branchiostoma floridae x Branchiostoma japonicum]